MRFEHLVEVNDLGDAAVAVLTRDQLWRGLVLRAEEPALFVPGLTEATILARTESGLSRALRYGQTLVLDEVHFVERERVRVEVPEQGDIPRSSLTMSIEEPRPGALFVRFVYDDERAPDDPAIDALRRAAYEDADVDTVGIIRWLMASGRLESC